MVDSLYADRGRVDDPHLWERAERFGLDLDRFEADRRADEVARRGSSGISSPASAPGSRALRRCSMPVPLSQLENESSESNGPPTGRPEVNN